MPRDTDQILTRLTPGKFDAQRAANFDVERAKGFLQSSSPIERIFKFDREARTAEFVFATDTPIEHWFGMVILDTDPKNVDLSRVQNGVCPFLVNHSIYEHCGVVVKNSVKLGSEIRGEAKFSRSQLGEDMLNDVDDEVRVGVSVGFLIHDLILERDEEGEIPVYRAKKWELLEVSLASIPADIGAHRSFEKVPNAPDTRANSKKEENTMTPEEIAAAEAEAKRSAAAASVVDPPATRSADLLVLDELREYGKALKADDVTEAYIRENVADNGTFTGTKAGLFARIKAAQPPTVSVPPADPKAAAGQSLARVNDRVDIVSIGEAFIRSMGYKDTLGKSRQRGLSVGVDVPILPSALKRATFDSASTGMQTYIDYQAGPILIEQ
jgi:phage head maturation protease